MIRIIFRRIVGLFGRDRLERELDEEIRGHLDRLAADFERGGMPADEARHAALRAFGGVEPMKERHRDRRSFCWIEDVARDIRYAVRVLLRDPGLASIAILTLALGIGANTALFGVIDALMLRRLPVRQPEELMLLSVTRSTGPPGFSFSFPLYEDFTARADAFSSLLAAGAVNAARLVVSSESGIETEVARSQHVSGNFFSVLGVEPAAGRVLDTADDRIDAPIAAAVLSDAFWARRFGRDPRVVGQRITLNEVPFTIVGVAPAGFTGVQVGADPEIWWPIRMMPRVFRAPPALVSDRGNQSWRVIGRLKPGESPARAQAQLEAIFDADLKQRLETIIARIGAALTPAERQAFAAQRVRIESGAAGWSALRVQFRRPLLVLMIVVGLVLLVACANVANLLLARATARRKEIAVRMALGSGRRRLVRQLLTESVLLAAIGGLLGVGVAFLGTRIVTSFMEGQEVVLNITPDLRVLAFTALVSLASVLVFGLLPSLSATSADLTSTLSQGRIAQGGGHLRIQNAVIVWQVALSVVVLIAAGLFTRTLMNLQRIDLGFDTQNLTVFTVNVPGSYDPARRMTVYAQLVDRLETTSGARASYSLFGLLSGNSFGDKFAIPGYTPGLHEDLTARSLIVDAGFFDATGTRLLAGRDFDRSDEGSPVRMAIVNEAMARRHFGASPLGKRFSFVGNFPAETFEIIGVARDSAYRDLREEADEAPAMVYLPAFQPPGRFMAIRMRDVRVVLRLPPGASAAEPLIRRVVREIDPAVAVVGVQAMSTIVDRTIAQERMLSRLAIWFGVLALVLGAIGIYGVRSYAVRRRASEIGLRLALGATTRQMFGLVVGQGMKVAAVGIALGLGASLALTRFVESLLFRVEPRDPATFVAVALVFAAVAAIASYVPARRAAQVDPSSTLRSE